MRQVLEVLKIKALFAFIFKTEATRASGRWSWTTKKSGSAWSEATGIRRASGAAFFAA